MLQKSGKPTLRNLLPTCVWATLLLGGCSAPSIVLGEDRLLQLVCAGHKSSREAIWSLRARMDITTQSYSEEHKLLSSEKHNIHWREQRGRLRFQETVEYSYGLGHPKGAPHKTTEDCSSKTNEMIALTTTVTGDGKEQKQGFLDSVELDYNRIAFINPWSRALFTVSDKPLLSVAKLLSERQQVQRISLAENGQMYAVEAVTPENNKVLLWFDVSRNFLTKRSFFQLS